MTFSEQLFRLRKQHGLTQEQLGEIAGVSRQTVSKWELGETSPELEKLHLLCDYFAISMDELTGREGTASTNSQPSAANLWCWHYEYKSKTALFGMPLVHINLGQGFPLCKAKGVIAIGNYARGLVAIGGLAVGLLAIGGVSLGLIALGGFVVGLLALGGIAVGAVALGAIAFGVVTIGSIAFGVYARGAIAMEWKPLLLRLLGIWLP